MSMKRIAFFIPALYGGGAERVTVNLLKGLAGKNICIDLVMSNAEGPYLEQVPKYVRIVDLQAGRVIKSVLPLTKYLRIYKPYALVSHLSHANVIAISAVKLARTKTKLIVVEHDPVSQARFKLLRSYFVPPLMRLLYPLADVVVAVSQGLANNLNKEFTLSENKVKVIYNPVVDEELIRKAKTSIEHPWFQKESYPVFLAVGRLTLQKDFSNLIQAFSILRKSRPARLVILGEGEARTELELLAAKLGVAVDVSLPGFVENPYAYMYNASAFVLSSQWEALPTVLIEAMACGCPVIATDCPFGPREILEGEKYGYLVPTADPQALSIAMLNVLDDPLNREKLIQRTQDFSVERSVFKYLQALDCA